MNNENTKFKYKLGDSVGIPTSGEMGEVIGRAQYSNADDGYLIRYRANDGRAVEAWWSVEALNLTTK
ncbi:MAG: hypothetical protein COB08_000725 [Rhodobacteraceae bacterium]|nr:hypothetical protein [Paracoccaceae bacterium]